MEGILVHTTRRIGTYASHALAMIFGGCASAPQGIEPVKDFQADRYLGTWYEIARLDHSFERGSAR